MAKFTFKVPAFSRRTSLRRGEGSTSALLRTFEYVFIVTYGRSGSTLLQGILNSNPGYLIRGENSSAIFRLAQYQDQLTKAQQRWVKEAPLEPKDAWFGIEDYPAELATARLRNLIVETLLRPRADTRVLGYKEIRWFQDEWRMNLTFMRRTFPGAKFVINTRNLDDVAKSKWYADNPDAYAGLVRYEGMLDEMEAYLGTAAYRVHFNDYVADPSLLAGLYDWLGEPFDLARIEAVMKIKHSS